MKCPNSTSTHVVTENGGYQTYKAADKLTGKITIITGGDSGIGRVIVILFAIEGADSLITYLPDEKKNAQKIKRTVEKKGTKYF